jgi:NAD+ diphosphatase
MDRFIAGFVARPGAPARLYLLSEQRLCVVRNGATAEVPKGAVSSDADAGLYLGQLGAEACIARRLGSHELPPPGSELVSLRVLFGTLNDADFGVAGRALTLLEWDLVHRFCGLCGQPTERSREERSRVCTNCGRAHYPRLSPAVITLVEKDGQALLARNGKFPRPFFSCLAGFVEPGETLEETVFREVEGEVGVQVKDVEYFGSQAWPLTHSLMIGFRARYAGGELKPDRNEIAEAGWFSPGSLPQMPGRISIARQLIDDFIVRHGGTPQAE